MDVGLQQEDEAQTFEVTRARSADSYKAAPELEPSMETPLKRYLTLLKEHALRSPLMINPIRSLFRNLRASVTAAAGAAAGASFMAYRRSPVDGYI